MMYEVRINNRFGDIGYTLSRHRSETAACRAAERERNSWRSHTRKHSHESNSYHVVTVHAPDGSQIETREALGC